MTIQADHDQPHPHRIEELPQRALALLNDPAQQRESYPFMDDWLDAVDTKATDVLHGWLDEDATDAVFCGPFSASFEVLVLASGQQVLRKGPAETPVPGGGRHLWEYADYIAEWVVMPTFDPGGVSAYLLQTDAPVTELYPPTGTGFIDDALHAHFADAGEAYDWAAALVGAADERGISPTVYLWPDERAPEQHEPSAVAASPVALSFASLYWELDVPGFCSPESQEHPYRHAVPGGLSLMGLGVKLAPALAWEPQRQAVRVPAAMRRPRA